METIKMTHKASVTNPGLYVLLQCGHENTVKTGNDAHEHLAQKEEAFSLLVGLCCHCFQKVAFCASTLNCKGGV